MNKSHSRSDKNGSNGTATDAPERVILYTRVSTDEQARTGTSLATQLERLRAQAVANDWQIVDEIIDDGQSGANPDRPGLRRVMEAAAAGKCDIVAAFAIDRWARKLSILLDIIEQLKQVDVEFFALREGWNTGTTTGRFGIHLMGAVAEFQRDIIAETTTSGRRGRAIEGKLPSGIPLYGYQVGSDGRLEVHPERAETVRLIFRVYTDERLGANGVCDRLNELGVSPPSNNPEKPLWHPSVVSRLLANPVYSQGYAEAYGVRVPCPPIIDAKTFEKAEQRRKSNPSLHPKRVHPWPLQGRIQCGACGAPWRVNNARSGRTYFCRNRERAYGSKRANDARCKAIDRQPADALERAIWRALKAALTDPAKLLHAVDASINLLKGRAGDLHNVQRIKDGLAEIVGQRDRLLARHVLEGMSPDAFAKLEREIDDREAGFSRQLAILGTDTLAELERTARLLQGAEDFKQTLASRVEMGIPADVLSTHPAHAASSEYMEFTDAKLSPVIRRKSRYSHKTLAEALDRLDAKIEAFKEHAEVVGVISFDATYDSHEVEKVGDPQVPPSSRRLG
ncbi:MAG: recombinase family protein [Chloroflexi bacterium]|nr:recombinase family protein [Chloroflexota bacterium]